MKFLLALVFSIALALATSPLLFTEESATEATTLTPEEMRALNSGPFTLDAEEDDSPETARFKAALRLLSSYTVVINQLRGCAASTNDPAMNKALANYHSRNGMIMSQVMRLVKQHGGLTPEIREELDERAAELLWADSRRGNCPALLKHISEGGEDLYKAPQHSADYQLLRSHTN